MTDLGPDGERSSQLIEMIRCLSPLDLPADKRKTNVFSGNLRSLFALQCFDSSFQFINTESPPLHRTPPQKSENSYYNGQDRQHQSRRPLIKPEPFDGATPRAMRILSRRAENFDQPSLLWCCFINAKSNSIEESWHS
jgi:hypothetical protein